LYYRCYGNFLKESFRKEGGKYFTRHYFRSERNDRSLRSTQRGDDLGKLENLCYTCLSIKTFLFSPALAVQV
jgi:hypothetical protein